MPRRKKDPDEQMQKARGLDMMGLHRCKPEEKLEAFMRVFHPKLADKFTVGKNLVARARERYFEEQAQIRRRKLKRKKK